MMISFFMALIAAADAGLSVQLVSASGGTGATLLLSWEDSQLFELELVHKRTHKNIIRTMPMAFENPTAVPTNELLNILIRHIRQNARDEKITPELFCGMVALTSFYRLKSEILRKFSGYLLDLLVSGQIDCYAVSEYCNRNMKYSTDLAKRMIVEMLERNNIDREISGRVLKLGPVYEIETHTCADFWDPTVQEGTENHGANLDPDLEFDHVHMRSCPEMRAFPDEDVVSRINGEYERINSMKSCILAEHEKINATKNKMVIECFNSQMANLMSIDDKCEQLQDEIVNKTAEIIDIKVRSMRVLLCLIGLLPSHRHVISLGVSNRYPIESNDVCRLVGNKNIEGFTSLGIKEINNIGLQRLETMKYLEICIPTLNMSNWILDEMDHLSMLMVNINLRGVRLDIPLRFKNKIEILFNSLGMADVETLKIYGNNIAELKSALDGLEGQRIRNLSINILEDASRKLVDMLELSLQSIAGIEGIDFRFNISNLTNHKLIKIIKYLKLKYVGIVFCDCSTRSDPQKQFLDSMLKSKTLKKLVIYVNDGEDIAVMSGILSSVRERIKNRIVIVSNFVCNRVMSFDAAQNKLTTYRGYKSL